MSIVFKPAFRQVALGLIAWLLATGQCLASISRNDTVSIVSPDHPASWYVGSNFEKIDQCLRWDDKAQALCLDLTYTVNGQWPVFEDPDLYHTFTVTFPKVHQDRTTHDLYFADRGGRNVLLGTVDHAFFGKKVVLRNDVELNAHRMHGVIQATLVVDRTDSR